MKILCLGDTHGSLRHVRLACEQAVRSGCDRIVQVGDWGFLWPGHDKLDKLTQVLLEHDLYMYFLDGNHDNHELLPHDSQEMVELSEAVTYLPRGHAWEWGGKKFMSLGGALSVDKGRRTPFLSWWPSETISMSDAARAILNGKCGVDVLFTHDAPEGVALLERFLEETPYFGQTLKMDAESLANRGMLRSVVDEVRPKLLVHGHYHLRYQDNLEGRGPNGEIYRTEIMGLDRDGSGPGSWIELEV